MRMICACCALASALLVAAGASAQEAAPPHQAAVSGPSLDVETATRAYLDRLTPEQKARSDAYFEGGYWLQLWGFVYGLGVAWIFLGTRLSRTLRALAERLARRKPVQTWLYGAQYMVAATIARRQLDLPVSDN